MILLFLTVPNLQIKDLCEDLESYQNLSVEIKGGAECWDMRFVRWEYNVRSCTFIWEQLLSVRSLENIFLQFWYLVRNIWLEIFYFSGLIISKWPPIRETHTRREIITVRGLSYVSRLPKYWPPSAPGECVLPPPQQRRGVHTRPGGEGDEGVSLFWKTRDIGLPSYSNNLYAHTTPFPCLLYVYITSLCCTDIRSKALVREGAKL